MLPVSVCWIERYCFTNSILSTDMHWEAEVVSKYTHLKVLLPWSVLDVAWVHLSSYSINLFFSCISVQIPPSAEFTILYNGKRKREEWGKRHLIGYKLWINSFISLANILLYFIFSISSRSYCRWFPCSAAAHGNSIKCFMMKFFNTT